MIHYLEAENAYTGAMTADIHPFHEALYKEMLGRMKQTDLSVPTRRGRYYYYSRTEEGKQYPIQCRRKGNMDAPDFEMSSKDEIAGLAESFRRMRKSLVEAIKLLEA